MLVLPGRERTYLQLFWGILLCEVVLIWSSAFPPLVDYPTHLANAYIASYYKSTPQFQTQYILDLSPRPNSGFYFILLPLFELVSPVVAGQILLSIITIIFGLGVRSLCRAIHQSDTWLSLIPIGLFLNSTLYWGMVNYQLGVGLFLLGLSIWVRKRNHLTGVDFALIGLSVTGAYLVHLSTLAFFALAFGTWSLHDLHTGSSLRSVLSRTIPFAIIPVALFITFLQHTGQIGNIQFGTFHDKLSIFAGLYATFSESDFLGLSLLLVLAVTLIAWTRPSFDRPSLFAGLVLVSAAILCPFVLFTSYMADMRFVLPAVVLLISALQITQSDKRAVVGMFIFAPFLILRGGLIWQEWTHLSEKIREEMTLLQVIPTNSHVFTLSKTDDVVRSMRVMHHIPSYGIITRHLRTTSQPAMREQSVISYRTPPYEFRASTPFDSSKLNWNLVRAQNDYVWAQFPDGATDTFLVRRCQLVGATSTSHLYHIRK